MIVLKRGIYAWAERIRVLRENLESWLKGEIARRTVMIK